MTPTELKARIKMLEGLRKSLKLNKSQFAHHIGLSAPEYSNILAGYRNIPIQAVYRLAIDLHMLPDGIEPRHKRTYRAVRMYWLAREGVQDTTAPSGGAVMTKPFKVSVEG